MQRRECGKNSAQMAQLSHHHPCGQRMWRMWQAGAQRMAARMRCLPHVRSPSSWSPLRHKVKHTTPWPHSPPPGFKVTTTAQTGSAATAAGVAGRLLVGATPFLLPASTALACRMRLLVHPQDIQQNMQCNSERRPQHQLNVEAASLAGGGQLPLAAAQRAASQRRPPPNLAARASCLSLFSRRFCSASAAQSPAGKAARAVDVQWHSQAAHDAPAHAGLACRRNHQIATLPTAAALTPGHTTAQRHCPHTGGSPVSGMSLGIRGCCQ